MRQQLGASLSTPAHADDAADRPGAATPSPDGAGSSADLVSALTGQVPELPFALAIERLRAPERVRRRDRRTAPPSLDPARPHGVPRAGQAIVATRRQLGFTQQGFAGALGVPIVTLRAWEQDRVKPPPAARAVLASLHETLHAAPQTLAAETREGGA